MINLKEKIAEIKKHWKVHLTAFLIPFLYMLLQLYEIWITDYAKYDLALKNGNIEVINKIKC